MEERSETPNRIPVQTNLHNDWNHVVPLWHSSDPTLAWFAWPLLVCHSQARRTRSFISTLPGLPLIKMHENIRNSASDSGLTTSLLENVPSAWEGLSSRQEGKFREDDSCNHQPHSAVSVAPLGHMNDSKLHGDPPMLNFKTRVHACL